MSSFHWNKKNKPNKKKIKPFIKEIINHQELEEDDFDLELGLDFKNETMKIQIKNERHQRQQKF